MFTSVEIHISMYGFFGGQLKAQGLMLVNALFNIIHLAKIQLPLLIHIHVILASEFKQAGQHNRQSKGQPDKEAD